MAVLVNIIVAVVVVAVDFVVAPLTDTFIKWHDYRQAATHTTNT